MSYPGLVVKAKTELAKNGVISKFGVKLYRAVRKRRERERSKYQGQLVLSVPGNSGVSGHCPSTDRVRQAHAPGLIPYSAG